MMRSRPASASATPETIVRAVPNLNFGTCAAASQTPANRMSRKPISARRVPCDAPERGSSCAAFFLPGYTHVETGRSRRHARTAVRGYLSCVRAIGQQRVIDLDARGAADPDVAVPRWAACTTMQAVTRSLVGAAVLIVGPESRQGRCGMA